ncbi:hypothetical protein [Mangrovibacter plantisponsor]|uniref:Uncharacterized protein n=1 Tax=Mangrovibacter plantisponsor TaxID=451513 RepID=A0A317PXQ6_9ENTR|nr:hypothetical protein [Mangrovibacter plantisponsor]PWW07003.1 hypothetical protein DES37_109123 [Mangrovibacter plantisponsor]
MNTLFAKSLSGSVITGTSLSDNSSHATSGHSVKTKDAEHTQDGSTGADTALQQDGGVTVSLNYSVESGEIISPEQLDGLASLSQRLAKSPSLNNSLFTDPATAMDAVSFTGFYHAAAEGVTADQLAEKLHTALSGVPGSGTQLTDAMDLAMTQARLNKLVDDNIAADWQPHARQTVEQFIQAKVTAQDSEWQALAEEDIALAAARGDYANQSRAESDLAVLQAGNSQHQQLRTAFLELTRDTSNSDDWFSTFSAAINGKGALEYEEQMHVQALSTQWQSL